MISLLNFLADETTNGNGGSSWTMIIVFAVLIVGMVVMMIIPQRRQKKAQEEMMAKLAVGSIITSIGGIIGTVVKLDDEHIWIETGDGDNNTTMQLLRQAIHSIAPAADSAEAKAIQQQIDSETDEIK